MFIRHRRRQSHTASECDDSNVASPLATTTTTSILSRRSSARCKKGRSSDSLSSNQFTAASSLTESLEAKDSASIQSFRKLDDVTIREFIIRTNSEGTHDVHKTKEKGSTSPNGTKNGPRLAMTAAAVSKDETTKKKITTRIISALVMVTFFLLFLYLGHVYICGLIFLVEVALFRELVTVRYNTFYHIIEDTIPLFRTTQWMWFLVAIFYAYGEFVVDIIKSNTSLHYLLGYAHFQVGFAFLLYSGTFMVTIATLQPDHIRFQVNQLCWTILVLCLTVGQLKYIMHNVYNGLFWFTFPILLVICNDTFAWLGGVTCGRKFIRREFIRLSPNKTWEGFIVGCIGTMFVTWHMSKFLAQFKWMTCPVNEFHFSPASLDCNVDPIFQEATNIVPPQIFELFPKALVQMIPGVVNICMVNGDPADLTACISGNTAHIHHHFEYARKMYPIQIHALSLGFFASFVAPFGGFLASAIKRAYGVKDYGSFIPGHGGIMDRMDCQFLMALYSWVHYNTFVKMTTVSVPKMIYMYNLLTQSEQTEFREKFLNLNVSG